MVNPNPARVTDAMWKLWTDRPNKAWRLGGIYVDFKKCYHNSVNGNKENWPDAYCIKLPLDLVPYNRDKGRAIDLTMSDSEMRKITANMKRSALDPKDNRLAAVKEFFGTLDSKTVFGLTKNSEFGEWRFASADGTHLWHIHMGVFTAFVHLWEMLAPILSVWKGESFAQWKAKNMANLVVLGDSGEDVKYWQSVHNLVRTTVTPPAIAVTVDGDYGDATALAFKDFVRKGGGQPDFDGNKITSWLALRYERALILSTAPVILPPSEDKLRSYVNDWLSANIPSNLAVKGDFKGSIEL
jgi:hypothetical protein